jgi:hypothetical protein
VNDQAAGEGEEGEEVVPVLVLALESPQASGVGQDVDFRS